MHSHDQIPVLIRHILEADIPQNARIVDQNIYPPEVPYGGIDDALAILDAVVVGYGLAARLFDLLDNFVCGL